MAGKLFVLLCSCSASEEWEETHIQPVSSLPGTSGRTLVCISKCVDYYVTVGNYTEYKDTYCWNEYYTVGSGGSDYYTGGEYDPGNFNIGNGTVENKSHFTFNRLGELYGGDSNLNMEEKALLNDMLNSLRSSCQLYQNVYDLLLGTQIKMKFIIDPNCEFPAYHINESITIRNMKTLDIFNFTEEFLHAVQDLCFYHEQMEPAHKNCEFEAKVFQELANSLYVSTGGPLNIPLITDLRPEFEILYKDWRNELIAKKCFTASDQSYFNFICNEWQGYTGKYNPNLRRIQLQRSSTKIQSF